MQLTARPRVMTSMFVLRASAKLNRISNLNPNAASGRQFTSWGATLNRAVNKRQPVNRMFEPSLLGGRRVT